MRLFVPTAILFLLFVAGCHVSEDAQATHDRADSTGVTLPTPRREEPSGSPNAQEIGKEWLSYAPAIVELEGVLQTKTYFGPPNYGENPKTDSKEEQWILALSRPVNVRGNPGPKSDYDTLSVRDISAIQLVLLGDHEELTGKNVIVKGTLFHGFTGHHHTDVLMNVQSINRADKGAASAHKSE
jgi:hypothetical protein